MRFRMLNGQNYVRGSILLNIQLLLFKNIFNTFPQVIM